MSYEEFNILSEILTAVNEIDRHHLKGVAVSQPSSLVPRSQMLEVYNEGKMFSGVELVGRAESCVAPTPAPHIPAYIPMQRYLDIASEVFGKDSRLFAKYDAVDYVSPQVTLWWKRAGDDKTYDLPAIYQLNKNEQDDFCQSISNKTIQSVEFITKLRGKPIIWGTWGHGTIAEREKEGLTRGGPTLKEGHLHVSYFDPNEQNVSIQQISNKDKLNHYAPWNHIILKRFGSALQGLIFDSFDKDVNLKITRENRIDGHPNGSASILNGFELNFAEPVRFREVLSGLIDMAGRSENLYENIHNLFNDYNKTDGVGVKAEVCQKMRHLLCQNGIASEESNKLSNFILSIQPTYGQQISYGRQGEITRYKRVRNKISKRQRKSLLMDIVEDTLKEPNDKSIGFTFPVHSSSCYILRDYDIKDGEMYVKKINLYPQFATTESGPERTLGVVLKRPVTQT